MSGSIGPMIGVTSIIAEYFGLIEGVNTKVTKLLHQAFNSAKANLEYARNTTGQNQIDYIKQARVEFNQAVAVEENENKILALVGLAMCQHLLGDTNNAKLTFSRINDVSLTRSERTKYLAIDIAKGPFIDRIIDPFIINPSPESPFISSAGREAHFELVKIRCLNKKFSLLQ